MNAFSSGERRSPAHEFVETYDAAGQTEPCGWPMRVTWSYDDGLAHAEMLEIDGAEPSDYCQEQMAALIERIEGQFFGSAEDLVRFLRRACGTRDFD